MSLEGVDMFKKLEQPVESLVEPTPRNWQNPREISQ